mmetsp:Transcript_14040/g.36316  ORF Transcript_14040/g.36316 Transcript_14040/m.36316 type:complete len:254 (-) Transcript_14040:307-1068(-)
MRGVIHSGTIDVGTKAWGQCVDVIRASAARARCCTTSGVHQAAGVKHTYPASRSSSFGGGNAPSGASDAGAMAGQLQWIVRESHRMRSPGLARSSLPPPSTIGSASGTGRKSPCCSAHGCRSLKAACSRCVPGTTQKPPVNSLAGVNSTTPCTHTRPWRSGFVPFWSQCHQPPCVFQAASGRNALPPSKLDTRDSVPQMASKAVRTLANVRRLHKKRLEPNPYPAMMPVAGWAIKSCPHVVGSSRRTPTPMDS